MAWSSQLRPGHLSGDCNGHVELQHSVSQKDDQGPDDTDISETNSDGIF